MRSLALIFGLSALVLATATPQAQQPAAVPTPTDVKPGTITCEDVRYSLSRLFAAPAGHRPRAAPRGAGKNAPAARSVSEGRDLTYRNRMARGRRLLSFTRAGAPPPARTDADASLRIFLSSARHGRRRCLPIFPTPRLALPALPGLPALPALPVHVCERATRRRNCGVDVTPCVRG